MQESHYIDTDHIIDPDQIAEIETPQESTDESSEDEDDDDHAAWTMPLYHSITIRRRGRIPLFKTVNDKIIYFSPTGGKTYCNSLHTGTFLLVTADVLGLMNNDPLLLLHNGTSRHRHLIDEDEDGIPIPCWCVEMGFTNP